MKLAALDTERLAALFEAQDEVVALVPVGSVEPHGPHLPLATDTTISEAVAARAAARLTGGTRTALVAPSVPYGVTDYAGGFAGAVSVPAAALSAFLEALARAMLAGGFAHVCFINNHLEPEQDAAVRAAVRDVPGATIACPLTRRWGRTLSAEFKSGACHAGRYETSLILAADPDRVDRDVAAALPSSTISLSDGIRDGLTTFRAMGIERAYTGAPAEATVEEGDDMLDRLATMVVTTVEEALSTARPTESA